MDEAQTNEAASPRLRRVAGLFNLAGWLVGIWAIVYPAPYIPCLAILVALPVVVFALVLRLRGRWTLYDPPSPGRISVGGAVMLPAIALGARSLFDEYLVDATVSLAVAGAAAIVIMILVALADRAFTLKRALITGILGFAWVWGGLVWYNDMLDSGHAQVVPVKVLNVTRLTIKTTSFTLYLSAWGPYPDGHMAEVTPAVLRRTHVGDTVCVFIWPGAFHWQRFKVEDCPV